ncbi:MAG: hypothetical protein U0797_08350 [Gemmataceae bacterium]
MLGRLDALKAERNYPVEWTRLVGLVQVSSQIKLATGDPDGAMMLAAVHRQLGEVLDKKAAEGPLGAALLTAGRTAMERAAAAWRDKRHNKPGLAEDAETALKGWAAATAAPALPFGAPAKEVELLFGTPARGQAVLADTPERVERVIDLLGLPLPGEGATVVVAFLDANGKLAEWQVAYRAKIDTLYNSPAQLAFRLSEAGFTAGKEDNTKNLYQQPFAAGDVVVEATRCNRSPALGGLVRITSKGGPAVAPRRSLRDFGPVHLDRGYEANRLALHPPTGGPKVAVKDVQAVKRVAKVLDTPTPDHVTLQRDKDADLLNLVELAWPAGETANALEKLLPSLWDDYGPGKLEDLQDQAGEYLAFTWSDQATRVRLRLGFDDRGPSLSARDTQPADQAKARVELARKIDRQERHARISGGKADERLSRSPGRVNETSLAGLKLGQSKAEAEKALPKSKQYRRKELPDGVSVTFLTPPDKQMPYWAKQLLVRYHEGRVAEVRLRYQRGPAIVKKGEPLLQSLLDASGAPESPRPAWAGLWGDVPNAARPVYYRWRDDRTVRTYQSDEGGMEVTWLDRPPEAEGLEGPAWQFVSTGIPHCKLGDPRSEVEAYFKAPATTSEGGEVYRTADSSPYEMVVAWYEGDKVSRVLAWHRQRCGGTPKEVADTLSTAWARTSTTSAPSAASRASSARCWGRTGGTTTGCASAPRCRPPTRGRAS